MAVKNKTSVAFLKNHLGGKEGGLEKQTWRLANAFSQRECDVTLLTSSDITSAGFKTVQVPTRTWCSFDKLLSFDSECNRFLSKNHFDIVFGLDRNSFQTHLRAGNGVHAAYLKLREKQESALKSLSFKLNPLHNILLHLEKTSFENPNLKLLLTNSHMVKNEILEHYHVEESKIKVVHNGVEWQELAQPFENSFENKKDFLLKNKLPENRYYFLFAGHDFKRKGLEVVLKALSTFSKDLFFLLVAGKDRHEGEFVKQAKALGLEENVKFFGKVENITPLYQVSDCLIIPSFYDPFANVTIEALAMGLNVITSANNGAKEILTPESGYVLSEIALDEMVFSISKVLDKPKTKDSAASIRNSVKELDFSNQLQKVVDYCLL